MSHIDKEFNKRFNNQQLSNDDFDKEGLWNAVAEDLANEVPSAHPFLNKQWLTKGIVSLIIVAGVLGVVAILPDQSEHTSKTLEKPIAETKAFNQREEASFSTFSKSNIQNKSQANRSVFFCAFSTKDCIRSSESEY